jgi:hypothetical protein
MIGAVAAAAAKTAGVRDSMPISFLVVGMGASAPEES